MKKSLVALSLLSVASFGAMADTPSFDNLQIGYSQMSIDGTSIEPDGYELGLNKSFNKDFYFNLDYAKLSEAGLDVKLTDIGVGYKKDLTDTTAFFGELNYTNAGGDADSDGYRAVLGVRSNLTANLELKAAYEYLDLDDSTDFFVVGAAWNITPQMAIYADYKTESDSDLTSVGVRFNF